MRNRWVLLGYAVLLVLAAGPEPRHPSDPAGACADFIAAHAVEYGAEVSCAIQLE